MSLPLGSCYFSFHSRVFLLEMRKVTQNPLAFVIPRLTIGLRNTEDTSFSSSFDAELGNVCAKVRKVTPNPLGFLASWQVFGVLSSEGCYFC